MNKPGEEYTATSAPKDPIPPSGGSATAPAPPPRIFPERVEIGDDEIAKRERVMGLDINRKTGRAYKSQGDFHNMGIGYGGRFRDGNAIPSAFRCAGCEVVVVGIDWRQAFQNCSAINAGSLRFVTEFWLCRECTLKALSIFPTIKGMVKSLHGGDLKRG